MNTKHPLLTFCQVATGNRSQIPPNIAHPSSIQESILRLIV
jgi:hypothetical protein